MAIPSQSATFNRVCGYTLGNNGYIRRRTSFLKWLKIGDANIQIENMDNKRIRVQRVNFEIGPDGKVTVSTGSYEVINSIEELKDMVRRYRLAHQKMKAIEKELKFQGDF